LSFGFGVLQRAHGLNIDDVHTGTLRELHRMPILVSLVGIENVNDKKTKKKTNDNRKLKKSPTDVRAEHLAHV
jgi:hypothetical protein